MLAPALIYFLFGFIASQDKFIQKVIQRFFFTIAFLLSLDAIVATMFFQQSTALKFNTYQTISFYMSIGIMSIIQPFFCGNNSVKNSILLGLFLLALATTGSSSAIVMTPVSILVGFVWCFPKISIKRISTSNFFIALSVFVLALAVYVCLTSQLPSSFINIARKFKTNEYIFLQRNVSRPPWKTNKYIPSRLELIEVSLTIWKNNPLFGVGLGNWQKYFNEFYDPICGYSYPHNFLAELLSETGLIGLFVYLLMIWFALFPLSNIANDKGTFFCKISLVFMLLTHLVNGDITDRWTYLFLGLASGMTSINLQVFQQKTSGPSGFPVARSDQELAG